MITNLHTYPLHPASLTARPERRGAPEAWWIAVVDDEPNVCKALRRLLRSVGLEVATFSSGEAFLKSVQEQTPDCLILDLHLPGLTGLDVQKHLTSTKARFPVVIITGRDEPGLGTRVLAAGAAAFLLKPVNDLDLLSTIRELLLKYYGTAPDLI